MCGLLRYARLQIDPNYPNFLDVKNTSFRPLQNTMDNVFKQLRKEGIGALKKNELKSHKKVARPDKQPTTTFPNDFFDGLHLEDLLN